MQELLSGLKLRNKLIILCGFSCLCFPTMVVAEQPSPLAPIPSVTEEEEITEEVTEEEDWEDEEWEEFEEEYFEDDDWDNRDELDPDLSPRKTDAGTDHQ
jgi:hypothetical protein